MQVFPKNDDIRRVLSHPTGVKFRATGPVDWPDDSYTHRRIADGDVTTSDPGAGGESARETGETGETASEPGARETPKRQSRERREN